MNMSESKNKVQWKSWWILRNQRTRQIPSTGHVSEYEAGFASHLGEGLGVSIVTTARLAFDILHVSFLTNVNSFNKSTEADVLCHLGEFIVKIPRSTVMALLGSH
jgi:hypothetical protein